MSSHTASTHKASSDPAEDESRAFKKTEQVVGRPPVTDHNINDEYLRDPPRVSTYTTDTCRVSQYLSAPR